MHGDIYGSKEELRYNSMNLKEIESKKFDYVALGHIHKSNFNKTSKIIYPGPILSYKFGGNKQNGMVVGEFFGGVLNLEFVPLDKRVHEEIELDITNIMSQEELVNYINKMDLNSENFIKIILKGEKNFEVNIIKLKELIEKNNIIKIYDNSRIAEDLNLISEEFNLKGIFVKNHMNKIKELDNSISDIRLRLQKETDPDVIREKEKLIVDISKQQSLIYKAVEIVLEEMKGM